jgi:hypothetical protein
MRAYSPAMIAYLGTRNAVNARSLLWVSARNRTTGAVETIGLWSGDDDRIFVIGGVSRLYYRAGGILDVAPIITRAGLEVRNQRVRLSHLSAPVLQMLRSYDARMAPVEIHRALFGINDNLLLEEPHRVFKGTVEKAPIPTPAKGGDAVIEMSLINATGILTRGLSLKKSNESQRRRSDDRGRRYGDVSGAIEVAWGEMLSTSPRPQALPSTALALNPGSDN